MRSATLRAALLLVVLLLAAPASFAQANIAAARASGAGTVVTLTGTVSRAKGFLVQMQDATAGISIRQTTGGIVDAIANGTIAPGTNLTVSGTLSEFRGLLQLNAADITSFTINSQGAPPAAQIVTLAQLNTAGETYESELVTVTNVTIAGTGALTAATTYQITDATANPSATALRIGNAGDTDADGVTIPTPTANVTGVVGQFDTATPPTTGYQILPVLASDIAPGGTSTEEGANGGLSLRVANPLQGTATVRFTTESTDTALALYDVLGRRVVVLTEGAAPGSRTATLSTAGLAPGVYLLRLSTPSHVLTQTVSVAR